MRHQITRIACLLVGAALIGWIGLAQSSTAPSSASAMSVQSSGPKGTTYLRGAEPSVPVGSPAIRPRLVSTGPSVPAFQAADAAQFASTHAMPQNQAVGSQTMVVSVRFLTSKQVSDLLNGESTGLPDSTLLCFVELQGTFTFGGGMGSMVTYHRGYEVFDAHSGNIIMAGGLP